MARPAAFDGGRSLSIHLLLAAAAMTAAQGQAADPLAPLPTQSAPQQPAAAPPPVLVPVQSSPQIISRPPSNGPMVISSQPSNGPTIVSAPPSSVVAAPTPAPMPVTYVPRSWAEVFGAIRNGRWAEAACACAQKASNNTTSSEADDAMPQVMSPPMACKRLRVQEVSSGGCA